MSIPLITKKQTVNNKHILFEVLFFPNKIREIYTVDKLIKSIEHGMVFNVLANGKSVLATISIVNNEKIITAMNKNTNNIDLLPTI